MTFQFRHHGWAVLAGALLCAAAPLRAQNPNEQLWVDIVVGKVWQEYNFNTEFSPRTLLSGNEPKWTSWNLSPTLERSLGPHWDAIVGVPLSYTTQNEKVSTFETDLQLGLRFYIAPYRRLQSSITLRHEQRFMADVDGKGDWRRAGRTRVRGELVLPLDAPLYSVDTLWYALTDFEVFIQMDPDLQERFAHRTRARIGIGRKFNYNWRVDLVYAFQHSRRAISDDALTTDSIFRLRLKYYFDRSATRPGKVDVGN